MAENEINRTILESNNNEIEQQLNEVTLPKKKKMVKRKPARKQVSNLLFLFIFVYYLLITLTDLFSATSTSTFIYFSLHYLYI